MKNKMEARKEAQGKREKERGENSREAGFEGREALDIEALHRGGHPTQMKRKQLMNDRRQQNRSKDRKEWKGKERKAHSSFPTVWIKKAHPRN